MQHIVRAGSSPIIAINIVEAVCKKNRAIIPFQLSLPDAIFSPSRKVMGALKLKLPRLLQAVLVAKVI